MATQLTRPMFRSLEPLFRRDPFESLQREIADLVRQTGEPWDGDTPQAMIPVSVDLSEADDSFRIQMDVPGVKPEDIDIEVTGNMVRIKGHHKEEKEEEGRTFH